MLFVALVALVTDVADKHGQRKAATSRVPTNLMICYKKPTGERHV
jgi:hypothetical protein